MTDSATNPPPLDDEEDFTTPDLKEDSEYFEDGVREIHPMTMFDKDFTGAEADLDFRPLEVSVFDPKGWFVLASVASSEQSHPSSTLVGSVSAGKDSSPKSPDTSEQQASTPTE